MPRFIGTRNEQFKRFIMNKILLTLCLYVISITVYADDYWSNLKSDANNGDVQAQMFFGDLYLNSTGKLVKGKAFAKSEQLALQWFKKAARHGEAAAQFQVAKMYEEGLGAFQSTTRAYLWAKLAVHTGKMQNYAEYKSVELFMNELHKRLSSEEITKVEHFMSTCLNNFYFLCDE
ncbi:MAG: TPR repeat protein [Cocleimonas sp.]|jgi:TPR repeat protein